jgi:hypothetical protein
MAKIVTPASLFQNVLGKLKDLYTINTQEVFGKPFSSLRDFGRGVETKIIKEFLTILVFFIIAVFWIMVFGLSLQFILVIINKGAYVTPDMIYSVLGGGGGAGFTNPSSCPLTGGVITLGSYDSGHEFDSLSGHGSQYYWNNVYCGTHYPIPQESGCTSPASCRFYGAAMDVAGGGAGTPVYLPQVNGQSVNWSCHFVWTTSGGSTINCDTQGGSTSVTMVLTHVNKPSSFPTNAPSGTQITTLFDQGGNTHLHMEVQINGVWDKPEKYFCGGVVQPHAMTDYCP